MPGFNAAEGNAHALARHSPAAAVGAFSRGLGANTLPLMAGSLTVTAGAIGRLLGLAARRCVVVGVETGICGVWATAAVFPRRCGGGDRVTVRASLQRGPGPVVGAAAWVGVAVSALLLLKLTG